MQCHGYERSSLKKTKIFPVRLISFFLGRRLQVTVWQRARKFEKNQCIGEAFIQLDNLTLTQLTLAWYKLFRENLVESEFYDSS
jgi:hypothetical protein